MMAGYLQKEGYVINHKKVYRIMKRNWLIKPYRRIERSGEGREFVRFRKVKTTYPLECVEMDIKMIWIPEKGKNAYLLTLIDVHTRKVLGNRFAFSIRQQNVIGLCAELVDAGCLPKGVVILSDNGSQFIARSVRGYLQTVGIRQEFNHIATPQENAHVEAWHGTLKRDLLSRVEYFSFFEIKQLIDRYVLFYNTERLHGKLGKITPQEKWDQDTHKMPRALQHKVS